MKHKFFLVISFVLLVGCNTSGKKTENNSPGNAPKEKGAKENFDKFLIAFIQDPAFRYSRINFPIQGYNSGEESADNYLWTKDDWDFYFNEDSKYKESKDKIVSAVSVLDTIATWRLYKENSGYDINYKFSNTNYKWHLIYYSYQNL